LWRVISGRDVVESADMRKELLSTPRFSVEQREYASPTGKVIKRYVVVHPGAAVILPVLDDRRLVMIRQIREVVEQELWELPAGTLEPGEPPIETATRELEEETGYRAGKIEPLAEFFSTPGICTEKMHTFLATDLTQVGQRLEQNERIAVEILETSEVRRMFLAGELIDAKTIAVLGLYFAQTGE